MRAADRENPPVAIPQGMFRRRKAFCEPGLPDGRCAANVLELLGELMRGGAREGAGRKAGRFGKTTTVTLRLGEETTEFLGECGRSRTEQVEIALRSSGEFKRWRKNREKR